jgi:DNA recombination protein RmuC
MFFAGLLVGAAALSLLLLPRLQAARQQAASDARHSERRLAELRAATEEKIALVAGNREQLAEQMKAISADALREVSAQVEKLATAQREADRALAAGELGKRSEEIKRTLDPIAESVRRVGDEVARLDRDRRRTHGQLQQLFESMTTEVARLRDQTGTLASALKRPQVRGAWGEM